MKSLTPWIVTASKRSLRQGNVFTRTCHSVRGAGGGFPACITGHMTSIQEVGLPTWWVCLRGGVCIQGQGAKGVCVQGGLHRGESTYKGGLHPGGQRGLHPGGTASKGVYLRGGSASRGPRGSASRGDCI